MGNFSSVRNDLGQDCWLHICAIQSSNYLNSKSDLVGLVQKCRDMGLHSVNDIVSKLKNTKSFNNGFSNGWSPEQNSSFGGFNSFSQKPGKGEEFTFDEIKEMLGYFIKVEVGREVRINTRFPDPVVHILTNDGRYLVKSMHDLVVEEGYNGETTLRASAITMY